ncbi:hypothetical protein BB559_003528 [Furculomyces boomerangus]|uniref:U1 small nuclear ribonucleoprotein 70 kDa n=2 Tax=Harpellales TaxID=61421 RepID=A0A2T9XZ92_9FUNG|nr:hypothetical protein BB559_007027 [Furculomyces boomerangus]PVU92905.1 hypothetical protein BB559_003528 [Furculomyces boomerangus]PVZ99418.1 hypothetical protein BB558_004559 [Smittium angustum]
MTAKLPPDLLELFSPRPPLPYVKPLDKDIPTRKGPLVSTISQYIEILKQASSDDKPSTETPMQKKDRIKREREEKARLKIEEDLKNWEPHKNTKATEDPYKTLIVSRLIKFVQDANGKSRGYAFIEYENESDFRSAYHRADGARIQGKRVVVDVERGRTVKDWKPRRLGGGLGGTRIGAKDINHTYSGRFDPKRGPNQERESLSVDQRGSYPRSRDNKRQRDYGGNGVDDRYRTNRSRNGYDQKSSRDRDRYRDDRDDRGRDYGRERDRARERSRSREKQRDRYSYRERSKSPKRSYRR